MTLKPVKQMSIELDRKFNKVDSEYINSNKFANL